MLVWITFLAMGLALSVWFTIDPRPDLAVSGWFYLENPSKRLPDVSASGEDVSASFCGGSVELFRLSPTS